MHKHPTHHQPLRRVDECEEQLVDVTPGMGWIARIDTIRKTVEIFTQTLKRGQ